MTLEKGLAEGTREDVEGRPEEGMDDSRGEGG